MKTYICKTVPCVVIEAENEEEAWEKLHRRAKLIGWSIQEAQEVEE